MRATSVPPYTYVGTIYTSGNAMVVAQCRDACFLRSSTLLPLEHPRRACNAVFHSVFVRWFLFYVRVNGVISLCLERTMAVAAYIQPTRKVEPFLTIVTSSGLIFSIAVVLSLFVCTFRSVLSLYPKHSRWLSYPHTTARSCCAITLALLWTANAGRGSQRFEGDSRDGKV